MSTIATTVKVCTKCEIEKPVGDFYKQPRRRTGLSCWCRACSKIAAAKWTAANRERHKALIARWSAENPDRIKEYRDKGYRMRVARMAEAPTFTITEKDRRRLQSGSCAVPGCRDTNIETDHVIPVARGGSHGIGNLQSLCRSHNQSKRDRLWIEFRAYLAAKAAPQT